MRYSYFMRTGVKLEICIAPPLTVYNCKVAHPRGARCYRYLIRDRLIAVAMLGSGAVGFAPTETESKFIKVGFWMFAAYAAVHAERRGLQIGENPMNGGQDDVRFHPPRRYARSARYSSTWTAE